MYVSNPQVLDCLAGVGAVVDQATSTARLPEATVLRAVEQAGKQYILHGRSQSGLPGMAMAIKPYLRPGQYAWFDHHSGQRRDPLLKDTIAAAKLRCSFQCHHRRRDERAGECAGADPRCAGHSHPGAEHHKAHLVLGLNRRSAAYILEIYKAVAGGKEAIRRRPMVEVFLEPISPLRLANPSLDNIFAYIEHGQPVCVGPMASVSGTGPATLAGTLAQENAEILAGMVVVQAIGPGTPMMYGGIPHLLDPRAAAFVFSSPEQALMAVAMVEIGKHYNLPVYVNVQLSDSKTLDVQAGMEKLGTLVPAMLAGADLFGHAGILGQDHGGSLPWLVVDNEAVSFAKRLLRGFQVDEEATASAVAEVGPGGNFLTHPNTLKFSARSSGFPAACGPAKPMKPEARAALPL